MKTAGVSQEVQEDTRYCFPILKPICSFGPFQRPTQHLWDGLSPKRLLGVVSAPGSGDRTLSTGTSWMQRTGAETAEGRRWLSIPGESPGQGSGDWF